jgi:hypothetical protein
MAEGATTLDYVQNSQTLLRFHQDPSRTRLVMGPVGCLAGESRIWTENGLERIDTLFWRGQSFRVWSLREGKTEPTLEWATAPFVKGREPLMLVKLEDGGQFRGAAAHRVQLESGAWTTIRELEHGQRLKTGDSSQPRSIFNVTTPHPIAEVYYDLTVETTGTYIGEYGIVHHNSGKTVACCWEVFTLIHHVPPCKDGVRRSRWCFIRDTATNLKDTTMRTWLECFPEDTRKNGNGITQVIWSDPMEMRILGPCLMDGGKTQVEAIIFCRHQGCEADAENLKSLNLTGYFVNEANAIPERNIMMLDSRIRRFPNKKDMALDADGKPLRPRFCGVLDTNMPDDQHWIYRKAEIEKPKSWAFFKQPPAMFCIKQPDGKLKYVMNRGQRIAQGIQPADNIEHLQDGDAYYRDLIDGKPHDWVRVYVMAEYGLLNNGRAVYPDYNDQIHYRDIEVPFDRTKTLFLGFDWGLHPSVVFGQMSDGGQLQIIDEVDGGETKMGIERLWESTLRAKLVNEYGFGRGTQIFAIGDPATGKSQVNEQTCVGYLATQGLTVIPCHTNAQGVRMGAVDHFLHRMADKGQPGILFTKRTQKLRKGMCGWYFFAKKESHRDDVYAGTPCDNSFTHVQDALQYLCHAAKNPEEYSVVWRNRTIVEDGTEMRDAGSVRQSTAINMSGFM